MYNFTVKQENEATVYQLLEDYFKANPTSDNISAYLYENHFRDSGNNYSHSFVWAGSIEGMGVQYAPKDDKAWELLLTKINQFIENSHSAATGFTYFNEGDVKPIQKYYYLDIKEPSKYWTAFNKYYSYRPKDRQVLLGNFSVGKSPDGETHWLILGFDDMKTAFDHGAYRRENPEIQKAWNEFKKNRGESRLVRSGLRIMLGSW